MPDTPKHGVQYALTGKKGDKCLSNGNTWIDSVVCVPPFMDRDSAMSALLEEINESKLFKYLSGKIGVVKILDNIGVTVTVFVQKLKKKHTSRLSDDELVAIKTIYKGGLSDSEEERAFQFISDMFAS